MHDVIDNFFGIIEERNINLKRNYRRRTRENSSRNSKRKAKIRQKLHIYNDIKI